MKPRPFNLRLCTALLIFAGSMQPAQAQYFSPFYMLGMGQSLLYPLTRAGGLGMPYLGGPYNANPFYSYNSYFRSGGLPNVFPFTNATYGPWGYRNAGMMPGYFNNKNNPDNQAQPSALNEPDNSNPGANTMNGTNPYQPPPPAYTPPQAPAPVPSSGGAPGTGVLPAGSTATGAPSFGSPGPTGSTPPPAMAPPVVSHPPAGSIPVSSPAGAQSGISAAPPVVPAAVPTSLLAGPPASNQQGIGRPLAEGFINHLNGNYSGDMSKALANPDTRSWARAMGVIGDDVQDGSHLSGDRLEVLGKVLRDNSLDPVSKLDTMRILLKKNGPASN